MNLLDQAREKLLSVCDEEGLHGDSPLVVVPLSPDEAIGPDADAGLAIKKGREQVLEATFREARGQAFTDAPSRWSGTLQDVLSLTLSAGRERAVFVAAMNAVLRSLGMVDGTVHCRDDAPERCGASMARALDARFGRKRVGLVGLQPAILRGLVEWFGIEAVRVLDLDPDNVGARRCGVEVWDGGKDLPRLVTWCNVGLATGSSLVNGTIDEIRRRFGNAEKPLVFFGNTISGAAALLGLDRFCPYGR